MTPTLQELNPNLVEALQRYVDHGIHPGGFLTAVLENNLSEAVLRADNLNIKILPEIVGYVDWEIPSACWGSRERVEDWLNRDRENV